MIKIRPNLSDEWEQQIARATTRLTVLSPFITQCSTVGLLANTGARIYTRFNVRDFVSGASCLDALKTLSRGCDLYEIPALHAKAIMDQESFVTLGSQNLTVRGGMGNLELNVCFEGDKSQATCAKVRSAVNGWITDAPVIDGPRIAKMCKRVERAKKVFNDYDKLIGELQAEADAEAADATRKAAARKARARIKQDAENLVAIDKAIRSVGKPTTVHHGTIIDNGEKTPFWHFPSQNLLTYEWSGTSKQLEPRMRYLCVLNKKKLGWARLAGGQITRIGRYLKLGPVIKGHSKLTVTISSGPKTVRLGPPGTNVVALIKRNNSVICRVPMQYRVDSLKMFDPVAPRRLTVNKQQAPARSSTRKIIAWLAVNEDQFEKLMKKLIAKPNDVEKGTKLYGADASRFIGPHGTACMLGVVIKNRNPILVASRAP